MRCSGGWRPPRAATPPSSSRIVHWWTSVWRALPESPAGSGPARGGRQERGGGTSARPGAQAVDAGVAGRRGLHVAPAQRPRPVRSAGAARHRRRARRRAARRRTARALPGEHRDPAAALAQAPPSRGGSGRRAFRAPRRSGPRDPGSARLRGARAPSLTMAAADSIAIRRAAGAVLRGLKRRGAPLQKRGPWSHTEPLRPALAIDAVLAAMRARFALPEAAANQLLRPALADWRDAVGCADPLLVPSNAQGAAAEAALVPIPIPSWCAELIDAGPVLLEGSPHLEGPRVVQRAWLAVVREAELSAVECYPVIFAGRYGSGAASLRVHLALSPPFLAADWRGEVCLRAGARLAGEGGPPVRIWLGAPASPAGPASGASGETAVTWVMQRGTGSAPDWPAGWPRWAVLRVLEGREPQALWELPAIWRARAGDEPEAGVTASASAAPGTLRLAVDIGSTSTVVVEEDNAAAGSIGAKLLSQGGPRPSPSGFRRLAGDVATAHEVGCAERLLAPGGQLPTALAAASARALAEALAGAPDAVEQLWLPQEPPEGGELAPILIDRFKSPELLLLSDWLAELPAPLHWTEVSRQLLEAYPWHLGRPLPAAPRPATGPPHGGRRTPS